MPLAEARPGGGTANFLRPRPRELLEEQQNKGKSISRLEVLRPVCTPPRGGARTGVHAATAPGAPVAPVPAPPPPTLTHHQQPHTNKTDLIEKLLLYNTTAPEAAPAAQG